MNGIWKSLDGDSLIIVSGGTLDIQECLNSSISDRVQHVHVQVLKGQVIPRATYIPVMPVYPVKLGLMFYNLKCSVKHGGKRYCLVLVRNSEDMDRDAFWNNEHSPLGEPFV